MQLFFTSLYATRNHFYTLYCNAKLNDIGDRESPSFNHVLFLKKDDNIPSILTALLVFCTHVLHIFIYFLGILNSSIHFHNVSFLGHYNEQVLMVVQ